MNSPPAIPEKQLEAEFQQLIYNISHDLQEPVSKIITISEYLREKMKNCEEADLEYLLRISESGKRLKSLIEALARYGSFSRSPEWAESVELKTIWDEAAADLAAEISRTGAKLTVKSSVKAKVDRAQIKQVFHSLISNALKFSQKGAPPEITLEARETGAGTEILVSDNGIGFEEKYSQVIFEPFQMLHPRGTYEGVGIGLAIVRRIVKNHGGEVAAKSRPGQGSHFRVALPHD